MSATYRKLSDERKSITHKFSIDGHEGYITVGKYEDGSPGEIFITMAKEGSTISGLMDSFATMTSLALQHGVPLQLLVDRFTHTRFEPSGFTKNPEIPMAKSVVDYIFRWLERKFLPQEEQEATEHAVPLIPPKPEITTPPDRKPMPFVRYGEDGPSCHDCGSTMVRNGACYKCLNCGATSGCCE